MKQKGICMKRIIYITIACAFLSVSFAKAQVLTLKECLEEGFQNNYSLRIIRNEGGRQKLITLNLNDENIIYSPDFYLRQNDILYVEPNQAKKQSANIGSSTNLLVSITSILISLAGLMVNILR